MTKITYATAQELKDGDRLIEAGYGMSIRSRVVGKPEVNPEAVDSQSQPGKKLGQVSWKAVTPDGNEIDYLITENLGHYGPNVYLDT